MSVFDRIEDRYNPDRDIPDGVEVSWVDYDLMNVCREQEMAIATLQSQVKVLIGRVNRLEQLEQAAKIFWRLRSMTREEFLAKDKELSDLVSQLQAEGDR